MRLWLWSKQHGGRKNNHEEVSVCIRTAGPAHSARLLLILIAMAAVQIALFSAALTKAVDAGGDFPLLEDVVADSRIAWILGAALLLCMAVLCSVFGKKASVLSAYTTCRLPVGEPAFYWGQALYNCCALLILLGAEIASVLVMVSLYDKAAALAGAQPAPGIPGLLSEHPASRPAAAGRHSDPCGKSLHASGSGPLRGALRQDAEPGKI